MLTLTSPQTHIFQTPTVSLPSIVYNKPVSSKYRKCNVGISTISRFSYKYPLNCVPPDTPLNFEHSPNLSLLNNLSFDRFKDPNFLGSMLQSCSNINELKSIHAIVFKCVGRSVTYVDNNLISSYVKFNDLEHAHQKFDEMDERDVVSWTALLSGYLKIGSNDEVLKLYSKLIGQSVKANSTTFVCVLKMCGSTMNIELGRQVHSCIVKGDWKNLIVDSTLIYFYAKCGDISSAFKVFDRMPEKDIVCWTTMITACAQQGYGKEALFLFSRMQVANFLPNEFTLCSILKACSEERALKFGKQLHGAILKNMFKDDVFIGSSLVDMYAKCGKIIEAKKLFDGMPKRNTVTWTSMIAGYAQNGLGEEALNLFHRMKRRRVFSNNLTVVSILSASGSIASLSTTKEIHAQILKNSIEDNAYIGSTMVWCYCKCDLYNYAEKVLQSMPLRDVVSWTAIISGLARLGHGFEALRYLTDMMREGIEPNQFTYSSVLKACAKLEAINQGKLIHASVNKTQSFSNVFVRSALIAMYSKCGFVSDAFEIFDGMPERNLVAWKSMIIGYARNGLCQEALKLMYRMQAEGFEVDDYILTNVLSACGDVGWDKSSSSYHLLQSSKDSQG